MTVRLPPNYVIVPASLMYSDLSAAIQRTASRIYGLAWESHRKGDRNTPLVVSVSLEDLMAVCDLSRRQLYAHLRVLVNRRVLRYTYSRSAGIYVFTLPPRSRWAALGEEHSAENRTVPIIGVVDVSSSSVNPHDDEQQQQSCNAVRGESEGGDAECGKPHAAAILDLMHVAEPTRSEILDLQYVTAAYLGAWRDWYYGQDQLGVGWVITQIRWGSDPPESQEKRERQRYLEWAGQEA